MRSMYYDRQGRPIDSATEWGKRLAREKRVAETTLEDGTWISTVWLGLDHGWGNGPPLIFETMVFLPGGETDECERYSTEEDARAGHDAMVAKWTAKQPAAGAAEAVPPETP